MVHLVKPVGGPFRTGWVGLVLICELAVFQKTVLVYPVYDIFFFWELCPFVACPLLMVAKPTQSKEPNKDRVQHLLWSGPSSGFLLAIFCTWQVWEQVLGVSV